MSDRIDRVVLLSLVAYDRWVPAREIGIQLGAGEAQIRTALADAIADGELIDASASGYRRYTEDEAAVEIVAVPVLTFTERRAEAREGVTTALSVALRDYRIAAGLSQNKLAREAGVDPTYVCRIERGQQIQPSRHVALSFVEVLNLAPLDTDRLLYAAGLAPSRDWQTIAEVCIRRLKIIQGAVAELTIDGIIDATEPPRRLQRPGA